MDALIHDLTRAASKPEDLPLFAPRVPDIRTPAPVAPGSLSSEEAAKRIEPHRPSQFTKIMLTLLASGCPLSREEISARTGIKESSACARIFELVNAKSVEVHELAGVSASGIRVDQYSLSAAGRARCQEKAA